MSFCAGSFCTCCRRASSASGTSGSSLTAGGRRCCRCASRSSGRQLTRRPSPPPPRQTRHGRYGFALSAVNPWRLWSDSPPPRRASALPRSATWNDHDLLFLISKLASVGAPAREYCPPLLPSHRRTSRFSQTASNCPPNAPFSAYLSLSNDQQPNSKRITSQCQTGSLQVALSKTPRRSDFASCPKLIAPERFRYSPRTSRPQSPGACRNHTVWWIVSGCAVVRSLRRSMAFLSQPFPNCYHRPHTHVDRTRHPHRPLPEIGRA